MLTTGTPTVERDPRPPRPTNQATPAPNQAAAVLKPLPRWMLWTAWLLVTLLGGLTYLTTLLLQTRGGPNPDPWFVAGPLLALGLAMIGQWILLRLYLGKVSAFQWLSGSLIGWGLLFLFAASNRFGAYQWGHRTGADFESFYLGIFLAVGIVCQLAGGVLLGFLQAQILRPYLPRGPWVWANLIGGGLATLLALQPSWLSGTFGRGVYSAPESDSLYEQPPWALLILLILLLVGGATGLVLARYAASPRIVSPATRPRRWPRSVTIALAALVALLALWAVLAAAPSLGQVAQRSQTLGPPVCGTWQTHTGPSLGQDGEWRAISVVAANDIWAVGAAHGAYPSIAHWDGTRWEAVAPPTGIANDGSASLYGVVGLAKNDAWAVGGRNILHWDGQAWSLAPLPSHDMPRSRYYDLQAVAAGSPDDVWVVGYYGEDFGADERPLALHWNGTAWQREFLPEVPGGELRAVQVVAPDDVWAAGRMLGYFGGEYSDWSPLVLHWVGHDWVIVFDDERTIPGVTYGWLNAIDSRAPDDVWAVGQDRLPFPEGSALLLHWDGAGWSASRYPGPSGISELSGVAALASDDVWAVGTIDYTADYSPWPINQYSALVLHWDGQRWAQVPAPGGQLDQRLLAITAVSRTKLWMAGSSSSAEGSAPNYGLSGQILRTAPCGQP